MSTLVQHTFVRSAGSVDSVSIAFGSNVTAGNTLVACVSAIQDDIPSGGVTDSLSQTFTQDVYLNPTNGARNVGVHRFSSSAGGADTVTLNATGAVWQILAISEWAGMATSPLSGTGTGEGTGTAPITASFFPSGPCTILGMLSHDNVTLPLTSGATYTLLDEAEDFDSPSGVYPFHAEYKQVGAGTYTADFTVGGSVDWGCVAAAYLDASAVESAGRPGGVRAGW
jgi:hypothetical protein